MAQAPDRHETDFYSFWAGARLLGPDLYNAQKVEALQQSVSPQVHGKAFIRPPFYAMAVWPLAQLPFPVAFVAWQVLNMAALLFAIGLWRLEWSSFLACAYFAPIWSCLRLGQDTSLLLVLAVLAVILIERRKEVFGGMVLALFVCKPNLVPLIPFLLLVQKRYRALTGFFVGGIALYLISSVVMGFDWIIGYTRAILANESTIWPRIPGLAALLLRAHAPKWSVYAGLLVGAALTYFCARNAEWRHAVAFTLTVAVVFAPRSMVYDLVLVLPLLLCYFRPWLIPVLGAALITIIFSPFEMIGEISAIAIAWFARPRD